MKIAACKYRTFKGEQNTLKQYIMTTFNELPKPVQAIILKVNDQHFLSPLEAVRALQENAKGKRLNDLLTAENYLISN